MLESHQTWTVNNMHYKVARIYCNHPGLRCLTIRLSRGSKGRARSISMFGSIELIDSQLSIENTAFEFLLGETQAGSVGGSSFR
jgi:hypothetical protein